jgi:hypothetical protein
MKTNVVITFEDGTSFSCSLSSPSLEIQNNFEEGPINMVSPWEQPRPVYKNKELVLRGIVSPGTDQWRDPPPRLCGDAQ